MKAKTAKEILNKKTRNSVIEFPLNKKMGIYVLEAMVEYAKQKCREQRSLCFHNYEETPAVLLSPKKGQPKRYYMDVDVILDAPEPKFD